MSSIINKKLIMLVKQHPPLYNPLHKDFRRPEIIEGLWNAIAKEIDQPVDDCREQWVNLRYEYQIFAKRLRNWYYLRRISRRPEMKYENELMFLWKFIPTRTFKNEGNLLDRRKVMKQTMSKDKLNTLISFVQSHIELYDSSHRFYGNAIRKGGIWTKISQQMEEKAWKCIKSWILLKYQCCYSILYRHSKLNDKKLFDFDVNFEFEEKLSFYKAYVNIAQVLTNKSYLLTRLDKRSFSILPEGQIEKDLIALVKQYPQLYNAADGTYSKLTDEEYIRIWRSIGKKLRKPASLCENTWIVLLNLHKELFSITVGKYQFKDPWNLSKIMENLLRNGRNTSFKPKVNLKRQEFLRNLIKTVKKYRAIYDKEYRTAKLDKTWEEIGAELNKSGPQCKRDWDGLRVSYDLYRAKISNSRKSRDGFLYAEEMSFVDGPPKKVISTDNENSSNELVAKLQEMVRKDPVEEMQDNSIFESLAPFKSKEVLLKIIAGIQKEPILYDYMRTDYNDKKLQKEAFDRIINDSGCGDKYLVPGIEKAWLKLRVAYWRYLDGDFVYEFMKKVPEIPKALEFLREFRVTNYVRSLQLSAKPSHVNFNINIALAETEFVEKCDKAIGNIVEYCDTFIKIDKPHKLTTLNNINILRFMAEVKKHGIIYNHLHHLYNNKLERLNTWGKIGALLNYGVYECNYIWCQIVKRFMEYKECDPSSTFKVNSLFWRDMIYMYSQKTGNFNQSTEEPEQFKPDLHISQNTEEIYANLGNAVNSAPKNAQRHLLRTIEKLATRFLLDHDCI